jgi:hypothetical protein
MRFFLDLRGHNGYPSNERMLVQQEQAAYDQKRKVAALSLIDASVRYRGCACVQDDALPNRQCKRP